MKWIWSMLVCTILLRGCLPEATSTSEIVDPPDFKGPWSIRMVQTGGIMGINRSIEISEGGNFTAIDERSEGRQQGRLTPQELDQLGLLLESIRYTPDTEPHGCADCFIYEIEISREDEKFTVQLDDINLDNSGLEPLVTFLRKILDDKLKQE